jgi:asparagine synthase (glutamine-hydrolysing)
MLLGDLFTYLPDNMLLRSDKVLMAASLEGRMPLLDIDIVARSSRSAAGDRAALSGSKQTIREAIGDLVPADVLRQPKRGFPVPIERFLVEGARTQLENLILSERALSRDIFRPDRLRAIVRGDEVQMGARELFVLASLEMWMRANVDCLSVHPPSVEDLSDETSGAERLFVSEDEKERLGRTHRPQNPGREHESPQHQSATGAPERGSTLGSTP